MKFLKLVVLCFFTFASTAYGGGSGSSSGGGGSANPNNAGFYAGIMTLTCTSCAPGEPPIFVDVFVEIDANGVAPNGQQVVFGNEFRISGADDVFFSSGERCRHRYTTRGTIMNGVISTSGSGSLLCGRFGDFSVSHSATLERRVGGGGEGGGSQRKYTVDQPFTWEKQ